MVHLVKKVTKLCVASRNLSQCASRITDGTTRATLRDRMRRIFKAVLIKVLNQIWPIKRKNLTKDASSLRKVSHPCRWSEYCSSSQPGSNQEGIGRRLVADLRQKPSKTYGQEQSNSSNRRVHAHTLARGQCFWHARLHGYFHLPRRTTYSNLHLK